MARAVLASRPSSPRRAADALELWIDAPTEERFARIRVTISDDGIRPLDPHEVAWWALASACGAAEAAGFSPDQ